MSDLKTRLREATKAAAVDLNPGDRAHKPKKDIVVETLPAMANVIKYPGDQRRLDVLIYNHVELGIAEREAKKEKEKVTEQIKEILKRNKANALMVGENRVKFFNSKRKTIVASLLLINGVSPSVVDKSTKESDAWTLKVTPPGQDDSE